jgi:hypothetical protein|nr:MAG TPA: head tail joining protein [Caudoviricetes sp.]
MAKVDFRRNIKNYHETYNDGILYFGIIKILKNAKKEKIGEKIEMKGKRPFANVTIRNSDNNIADSLGYTIDKKVKIPFSPIPENIKVKINNEDEIYEVKKCDSSDNKNIYLYLQKTSNKKVGDINER